MLCIRCGEEIKSKGEKFCSLRCSKLHHKKIYRQRNRDKIRIYQREWKKRGIRGSPATNGILRDHLLINPTCAKCGTTVDIHVCHIKPRVMGGKNHNNLITLCRKHHHLFDELLRSFWASSKTMTMRVEVIE